jgi:catechol 2,3-dioxygenase-like lactoylglutathione lyase family enzyme
MSLHRLTHVTLGVPDVAATAEYYSDFGLLPSGSGTAGGVTFASGDGGEQLTLVPSPRRRLVELRVGVDDGDDLDRIAAQLTRLGLTPARAGKTLTVTAPAVDVDVVVEAAPRVEQPAAGEATVNQPGRLTRTNARAAALTREHPVQPRKLGHVVLGSTHQMATQRFFTEGLGFQVSDEVPGMAAFMRCSTDHHNVLVLAAPVSFLHHTAWEVDDVDEIGRGATAMLAKDPARHVWGLGRHHIGSNFFWYLKDPAGNFTEYYSDLDCIVDEALWKAEVFDGARGLFNWGPAPPPSFLEPEDLAALMTAAHR